MEILVVDDSPEMVTILTAYLKKAHFEVYTALNGRDALAILETEKIDLLIVDWMMPEMDGIEIIQTIKQVADLKIMMLTAKSEITDEVESLTVGADEFIRKPFDPQVLLLRIKRLLGIDELHHVGDLVVDMKNHRVWKDKVELQLTKKEYELLNVLLLNRGRNVTREQLIDNVWGLDYEGVDRTVDTHIRRLREKIGADTITTRRGLGYCIEK
ncbi:response regulator transcription factor [Brochothrix thermosphacta]|uniref:response regulator transcription factor n=1 Tax=Brochothrix thermosphacta TaxID=2756 RepID=UPI00265D1B28|nr:response regulator transcription factor [Brochothrix thermosphacta]WKK68763.1 response regulator transcription factor [Brochothrix thermosphacta]